MFNDKLKSLRKDYGQYDEKYTLSFRLSPNFFKIKKYATKKRKPPPSRKVN